MTPQEIISIAKFIQYPVAGHKYHPYHVDGKEVVKLPLTNKLYAGWKGNAHHYTTEYQRNTVFPILGNVLGFDYDRNDFTVRKQVDGNYDISNLVPKMEFTYEIYGLTRGEHFDNLSYDDISSCTINDRGLTGYHRLYKYPHECSRVINKTLDGNGRTLLISGDSQMIPNIAPLTRYFREIWYLDKRNRISFKELFSDVVFTDVLVQLYNKPLQSYTERNLD